MEPWRAALARWGEPIFDLALLLTNDRATAESAVVAAFTRTFAGPPPAEPETALYKALVGTETRARRPFLRIPLRRRQDVLPRNVAQLAPSDRLLLGLWLLRHLDATQLAAVVGQPAPIVTLRLATIITKIAGLQNEDGAATHLTLDDWLADQLGLNDEAGNHLRMCLECRRLVDEWRAAINNITSQLRTTLKPYHLPYGVGDTVQAALNESQELVEVPWWHQRRVWLPSLLGGIALILLLLIVPWSSAPASSTGAALSAQELVQATLNAWTEEPSSGTLHRQVWAIDQRLRDPAPVITDVWQTATGEHRVEAHNNQRLVEWQYADGRERFSYGADPLYSSCRWNTAYPGHVERFNNGTLLFRVGLEDQKVALQERLLHGAYGLGYSALEQALVAGDLRSFGTRTEGDVSLVVLSYTDERTSPAEQVLLRIDPLSQQLYNVQRVALGASQTAARPVWRLQQRDEAPNGVPQTLPDRRVSTMYDELLDPGCPALRSEYLLSLRALLTVRWQGWYLPATMPQGLTRAALFAPNAERVVNPGEQMVLPNDATVLFTGPDRWLSVSGADWESSPDVTDLPQHGLWRVELSKQRAPSLWRATLRLASAREITPSVDLWANGWTEAELLEVIAAFEPFNGTTWLSLDEHFLDLQPLPTALKERLQQSFTALEPQPVGVQQSRSETTVRVEPLQNTLSDTYHVPAEVNHPQKIVIEQWAMYNNGRLMRYRMTHTLPDGTLYQALVRDETSFSWYNHPNGKVWTGGAGMIASALLAQPESDLLLALFHSTAPITMQSDGQSWLLEQSVPFVASAPSINIYEPISQQRPWLGELPDGQIVRRLWLDQQTYLPSSLAVVHRDGRGAETMISATSITKPLASASPRDDVFALPRLPDDVLTFNVDTNTSPVLLSQITPMEQVLVWPDGAGPAVGWYMEPRPPTEQLTINDLELTDWADLSRVPSFHRAEYLVAEDQVTVRVTQGPRKLFSHMFRYSSRSGYRGRQVWDRSELLRVQILGQTRDAWLLQNQTDAVLVIEIDDLMLHIAAPAEFLRGPLLDLLPQLERSRIRQL